MLCMKFQQIAVTRYVRNGARGRCGLLGALYVISLEGPKEI